jgi:hypothetical protein
MRGSLNIEALRRLQVEPQGSLAPPSGRPLTRRSFLRLSGTTALAPSVIEGVLATAVSAAPFRFAYDGRAARFFFGNQVAWQVDPSQFAGTARLQVRHAPDRIELWLRDARLPGSAVPAGLHCLCLRRPWGWWIGLELDFARFAAEGRLIPWLRGDAALEAAIPGGFELLRNRTRGIRLQLEAPSRARFAPPWRLDLEGTGCAAAATREWQIRADHSSLGLPDPTDASLFATGSRLRSRFVVHRGHRDWDLSLPTRDLRGARLALSESPFDHLEIEAEESPRGNRVAFVARHRDPLRVVGTLHPGAAYRTPAGETLRLPLRDLRLAAAFDGSRTDSAFLASLGNEPVCLDANGCRLRLADDPERAPLEVLQRDGAPAGFRCAPLLLASLVPLEGVLTLPVASPHPNRVALLADPAEQNLDDPSSTGSCVCDRQGALDVHLPNCSVLVIRPEDLMVLRFEFRNLRLRKPCFGRPHLEAFAGDQRVIVHFPPQHLAERAFYEAATDSPPDSEKPLPPPVESRTSRPSRLAFDPKLALAGTKKPGKIPFTLQALLAWDQWQPMLVPDKPQDGIVPPACDRTDIEFPWRLHLSPDASSRWRHSATPIAHGGRYELWHTRLFSPTAGDTLPSLRAVWSPDYDPNHDDVTAKECPFRMSLNNRDRHQLVQVTYQQHLEPVYARLFLLSALGAWSDIEGNWPCKPGITKASLERWLHVATMGRDQNVIIERRGFLFPLGHRATLVKQTERKIVIVPIDVDGVKRPLPIAYLRQHKYIQIKEPCRDYSNWSMAWRNVCFLDKRSPYLNDPLSDRGGGVPFKTGTAPAVHPGDPPGCPAHWGEMCFWPTVGNEPYKFKVRTLDYAGNQEDREIPLIFVENSQQPPPPTAPITCDGGSVSELTCPQPNCAAGTSAIDCMVVDAAADYNTNTDRRTIPHKGAALALALSYRKGDTEVEAQYVQLTACLKKDWSAEPDKDCYRDPDEFKHLTTCDAPFWPRIQQVQARVPAIDHLLGNGGIAWLAPRPAETDPVREVFAELVKDGGKIAASFDQSSDRSGGVLAPTPNITQLSRRFGPGTYTLDGSSSPQPPGGADPPPQLSPAAFFGDSATILGKISLGEIVKTLDPSGTVPALLSTLTPYADGPDFLEQTLNWSTSQLQNQDFGLLYFLANQQGNAATFSIDASFRVWLDTQVPPAFDIIGKLTTFSIRLGLASAGVLIEIPGLSYHASNDRKPEFQIQIGDVTFLGALAFIQKLAEYLGSLLAEKTGLELELQTSGILVRFPSLSFPTINVGAMSLSGLAISSWAKLPFTAAPVEFGLNFSRPEAPCVLTVGIFGGRAYVTLILDTAHGGIRDLAAAFEFGAIKELSFGPAHGQVYVLAGIYYGLRATEGGRTVEFRAYIRAGGNVDVLGLITAYIDLYIGLLAQDNGSESYLLGEAELTIGFKIGIFEHHVTLRRSERLAGSKTGAGSRTSGLLLGPALPEAVGVYASLDPASWELDAPAGSPGTPAGTPAPQPPACPPPETIRVKAMILDQEWSDYWQAFDGTATTCRQGPCEAWP